MEAVAKLKDVPTSPRKMRLIADLIRGQRVSRALGLLKYQPQAGADVLAESAFIGRCQLAAEE